MADPLLDGRTAVVTGGASGIGRAISRTFAAAGADVVVADVQPDPREGDGPTHELIERETDAAATYVECDVTNRADLVRAVDAADAFGGVDTMVNNAGIFRSEDFLDITEDAFDRMFAVNVKGTFFGAQVAAERMLDAGDGGAIVNLSSVAGMRGSGGHVHYCASKGAVRLLTYSLADALGPAGIRTNAVHPGVVETKMTTEDVPIVGSDASEEYASLVPSTRPWGTPQDVADAALYLASDMAAFVNGQSLVVDGGRITTS
ncbi:SDR family oxidoreductase [Halorarius litoreus]|uniref:SDR family oxidoreductase n=1 Tax=Halorarius litoreus TaxID=2962676 RepID=UPI0020CC8604|nr:SDR family oxidoreductase [Halorarius litoreus]